MTLGRMKCVKGNNKRVIKKGEMINNKKLCLTMIVKNEVKVIKRCIDSVRKYIDYWVIIDTGSVDGTQKYITELMSEYNIPGELHEREWVDFSTNRNQSIEIAKSKAQFSLIIDADDYLKIEGDKDPFSRLKDTVTSCSLTLNIGNIEFTRKQIINNCIGWKYVGKIHEILLPVSSIDKTTDTNCIKMYDIVVVASTSANNGDPLKVRNDEELLKESIEDVVIPELEFHFKSHLAELYLINNKMEQAKPLLEYILNTDIVEGKDKYIYSLYNCLITSENKPFSEKLTLLLKTWEMDVSRIEAVFYILNLLSQENMYIFAYNFYKMSLQYIDWEQVHTKKDVSIWNWKIYRQFAWVCYCLYKNKEAIESVNNINLDILDDETYKEITREIELYKQG